VLCLAEDDGDRLIQLAAVLAVGSRALWPSAAHPAWQRLPEEARDRVALVDDWSGPQIAFDAIVAVMDALDEALGSSGQGGRTPCGEAVF